MIPVAVEGSIPIEELYENLWIVDRQAYDTCAVNTSNYHNRILLRCDTPLRLRYFTIVFQRFSAEPSELVFEPGKDYFFIGNWDSVLTFIHTKLAFSCQLWKTFYRAVYTTITRSGYLYLVNSQLRILHF